MEFYFNDEPLMDREVKLPKNVQKMIKVLDELPDGMLIFVPDLLNRLQLSKSAIRDYTTHPEIERRKVHGVYWNAASRTAFGNPSTIEEYKKRFSHD
jgi:hypothetical protein